MTFSIASIRERAADDGSGVYSLGAGFRVGSSTTFVSSRPSISTFVVTKRLAIRVARVGGGEDGAEDLRVRAAAAEISAHAVPHVVFGRIRVFREERDAGAGRQTGRTKPYVQRVFR